MKHRKVRCAIYTRKSTEEGLDQAFNSLDAQREACEAYIKSQVGENWVQLRDRYDDGGYSGGSLERPALKRLMEEIDNGHVDTVVVYKIDRLTRSLADFAKIIERFDARNVSFVSVTQAFNTTTSMGRLTLNVLLSFAQFEREVTAERIRDKIAASRAKGIFMGGTPPLGYDARDRKLIINESEAETVRLIFNRYLQLGSIARLRAELDAKGIMTKSWTATTGRKMGGYRWHVGPLRSLLRNRVYVGEAVHKGKAYPGEHEPILSRELFDSVQERIESNRNGYKRKITIESKSLLTGIIFDSAGYRMTPVTKHRHGNAYRYYVSQARIQRFDSAEPMRPISAHVIESIVCERVAGILAPQTAEDRNSSGSGDEAIDSRPLIRELVSRVEVGNDRVAISLQPAALAGYMKVSVERFEANLPSRVPASDCIEVSDDGVRLIVPGPLKRSGSSLGIEGWEQRDWGTSRPRMDRALVKALVRAHVWRDMIEAGDVTTLRELAKSVSIELCHVRELLRLAFLEPEAQRSILSGRGAKSLTLESAAAFAKAIDWRAQVSRRSSG